MSHEAENQIVIDDEILRIWQVISYKNKEERSKMITGDEDINASFSIHPHHCG